MKPQLLTKASLLKANIGRLFVTGSDLRSFLLERGYKQADLCELISLPSPERLARKTLVQGMSFIDGTRLSEDTEVSVLVPEQPLVLKFFQGKGSGKTKHSMRVHLFARLLSKDVTRLLPNEKVKGQVLCKEVEQTIHEYEALEGLGIFD
jgi:hypothetical protein